MLRIRTPRNDLRYAAMVLLLILAVVTYASKWCLSQTVDDMIIVATMSEFPDLLRGYFYIDSWFYPFGVDVRNSFDLNFLASIIGNLIYPLSKDWVATQRAVAFLLVFLTGLTMYYAINLVYKNAYGALLGAAAYATSNQFIMRMPSHLSLLGGFVFPVIFLGLHLNKPFIAGLALGLAYWSSPFYGLIGACFAGAYLVWDLLENYNQATNFLRKYLIIGLIFGAMTFFLIPTGMKTFASQTTNTLRDLLWRHNCAYFFPTGWEGEWERTASYVGLVTLVFGASCFVRNRDKVSLFMLATALIFAGLSMVPIPYLFFSHLRGMTRFSVITVFGFSFLLGGLFQNLKFSTRAQMSLASIVLMAIVADNLVAPPSWYFLERSGGPFTWYNKGYDLIRNDASATAEIHFPIMPTDAGLMGYQYYRVLTHKKIVDAQTTGLGRVQPADDLFQNVKLLRQFLITNLTDKWVLSYEGWAFQDEPDSHDFRLLRDIGIDYLILHKRLYSEIGGTERAEEYLGKAVGLNWLTKIYDDVDIGIYKVTIV